MKRYFKVLDENGRSYCGGDATWSLPTRDADGTWIPGEWMPCVAGELYPCVNGYHVVTPDQLVRWLGPRIFEVEIGPEIEQDRDKSVVRTCRLLREYTNWNERIAWYFACDCADRVLHIFEFSFPKEDRPRKAIETARRYINGKAMHEELNAIKKEIDNIEIHLASEIPTALAGYCDAVWAALKAAGGAAIYMEERNKIYNLAVSVASYAVEAVKKAGGNYLASAEAHWQARRLFELLGG